MSEALLNDLEKLHGKWARIAQSPKVDAHAQQDYENCSDEIHALICKHVGGGLEPRVEIRCEFWLGYADSIEEDWPTTAKQVRRVAQDFENALHASRKENDDAKV